MEWIVSLDAEIQETFSEELADRLLEALKEYSPAVSGRGGRVGITMSIDASNARQAFDRAHSALRQALGRRFNVVDVRVQTLKQLGRELEAPAIPALAGISEIAEILGVSRQRASELAGSDAFPKPVANLAAGPVWLGSTVLSFNQQWERRPGRPKGQSEPRALTGRDGLMGSIQAIKEAYEGEWLAIAVTTKGKFGPEEGELIFHSTDEGEVWRRIKGDDRLIYVTYAGPLVDEGYAVAF